MTHCSCCRATSATVIPSLKRDSSPSATMQARCAEAPHSVCPGRYMAEGTLFIAIASMLHVLTISKGRDEQGNEITIDPATAEYTSGLSRCVSGRLQLLRTRTAAICFDRGRQPSLLRTSMVANFRREWQPTEKGLLTLVS